MTTNCSPCHIGGGIRWDDITANVGAPSSSELHLIEAGSEEDSSIWHQINGTQGTIEGGGGSRMP